MFVSFICTKVTAYSLSITFDGLRQRPFLVTSLYTSMSQTSVYTQTVISLMFEISARSRFVYIYNLPTTRVELVIYGMESEFEMGVSNLGV